LIILTTISLFGVAQILMVLRLCGFSSEPVIVFISLSILHTLLYLERFVLWNWRYVAEL
jgi:hypothetical protein